MTCGPVGAVRSKAAAHPVAGSCIFDPSLLLGDQAPHELGPFHSPSSQRVLPFPHLQRSVIRPTAFRSAAVGTEESPKRNATFIDNK
jgi:hypothetical protein